MIKFELSGISKGDKYDSIINDLRSKLQTTDEELEAAIEALYNKGDYSNNFRTCLHKKCVRIFEHNFV